MSGRWLSIIGIGEDGRAGLSPSANALIDSAELVVGGARHLELVGETRGLKLPWRSPLEATVKDIEAHRAKPVAVLASGDPFWYGAGATLARSISADEMLVLPAPSSFALGSARLGWPLQDIVTLGLNMRGLTPLLRRHIHDGRRILALSLNGDTPRDVASLLDASGYGASEVHVMESLGGQRERIRKTAARDFDFFDVAPLNIVGIEVRAGADAKPIPYAAGLPDDYFENDGQLTKREIRAVTLSSLAPCPGQLLWDIGVGSGSVGIEWLLAHPANRAIGIERDEARAARAARNAIALGVPHFDIRQGSAPEALLGLPQPDAAFIGGGSAGGKTIAAAWDALKPGGVMVVNGVTLETELAQLAAFHAHGGSLTRLSVERADGVGTRTVWRPAMPVLQWIAHKPRGAL